MRLFVLSETAGDYDLMRVDAEPIDFLPFSRQRDFSSRQDELATRWVCDSATSKRLLSTEEPLQPSAYCAVCRRRSTFTVATGQHYRAFRAAPNWRETLACTHCGLINRLRALIEFLRRQIPQGPHGPIYLTEHVTPLYRWLVNEYPEVFGSEYFGDDHQRGKQYELGQQMVAHEDVTRLSFEDHSVGHVLSFDVLEHVPNYRAALAEFVRVLYPGGTLLLSVPFDLSVYDTQVRASVNPDGSIRHHKPPEYHDDPVRSDAGALCFYHFGWEFLDELRAAGFEEVRLRLYWDPASAYLGWIGVFITACKSRNALETD